MTVRRKDKACHTVWSKRVFPERHSGKANPRPTGADQDIHALRHEQMEEDDTDLPVALRHEARKRRSQLNTKERRGKVTIGEILGSTSGT